MNSGFPTGINFVYCHKAGDGSVRVGLVYGLVGGSLPFWTMAACVKTIFRPRCEGNVVRVAYDQCLATAYG